MKIKRNLVQSLVVLILLFASSAHAAGDPLSLSVFFPLPFVLLCLLVLLLASGWFFWQWQREKKHCHLLQREQTLYRQILDGTPCDILWFDADLQVIGANRPAQTSLGADLAGRRLQTLAPELVEHPVIAALQAQALRGPGLVESQTELVQRGCPERQSLRLARDGTRPVALLYRSYRACVDNNDTQHHSVCPKVQEEADLASESAIRMKSEFIANINHEIRTPMNAIIGYAEMLADSNLGEREQRYVNTIQKSGVALVSIFNDIMELSKIDAGRLQIMPSSVRMLTIFQSVEELFAETAREKSLTLQTRIAEHLPPVILIDGIRLKQVLQNLVSNALKFTQQGSVVMSVTGELCPGAKNLYNLEFAVEDTGCGITLPDQQKIWQLFEQHEVSVSNRYGGVGLGLTLCSRLVVLMGGKIELVSREGEGTRFTIRMDAVQADATPEPLLQSSKVLSAAQRSQTILVVDDMDLITDVFTDYFEGSAFTVLTAANGSEALEISVREQPGIVFMDLNLGGTDGRKVTEQLKAHPQTKDIPVVVMTGEILEEEDYKPLFDDFLQKPFKFDRLQEILSQHGLQTEAEAVAGRGEDYTAQAPAEIAAYWSEHLDQLCQTAMQSGSFAAATALAAAMQQSGLELESEALQTLGQKLQQYIEEPDIAGVDRLLTNLSRVRSSGIS